MIFSFFSYFWFLFKWSNYLFFGYFIYLLLLHKYVNKLYNFFFEPIPLIKFDIGKLIIINIKNIIKVFLGYQILERPNLLII
jgi:hypothetical protein